jgi:probable rRNA maturation factor
MTCAVDIAIADVAWRKLRGARKLVERAVDAARAHLGRSERSEELSVLLCGDAEIRGLNKTWRGKDKATNVLSFPAIQGGPHLGDIAVAHETVAREAAEEGKTMSAHLAHMIVHGYLHLVGYDHETSAEADAMEALEREILDALGIADPYAQSIVVSPKSLSRSRRAP